MTDTSPEALEAMAESANDTAKEFEELFGRRLPVSRLVTDTLRKSASLLRALAAERRAALDKLPCDVMLPPATRLRAGVSINTLMLALSQRLVPVEFASPAPPTSEGYVLVPVEPTEAMKRAAQDALRAASLDAGYPILNRDLSQMTAAKMYWRAMIAAAPSHPEPQPTPEEE